MYPDEHSRPQERIHRTKVTWGTRYIELGTAWDHSQYIPNTFEEDKIRKKRKQRPRVPIHNLR